MVEIWDGYFRDGTRANIDLIRGDVLPDGILSSGMRSSCSAYGWRLFTYEA